MARPDGLNERLIVRGRSHLIGSDVEEGDVERIKSLFDDLERKQDIANFLDLTEKGEGVRIFIGSENKLSHKGSSLVVSSYMNADHKVIGAIGVIGPKRLNYGRMSADCRLYSAVGWKDDFQTNMKTTHGRPKRR